MNPLALWSFFSKGGWILVLAGVVGVAYAREIKAAEERGALKVQIAADNQERLIWQRGTKAHREREARDSVALAGLAKQQAAAVATVIRIEPAHQRSDSAAKDSLAALRARLPELAGAVDVLRGALDTANQVAAAERTARKVTEAVLARVTAQRDEADSLLTRAGMIVAHEKAMMLMIAREDHRSPIGLGCSAGVGYGLQGVAAPAVVCGVTVRF